MRRRTLGLATAVAGVALVGYAVLAQKSDEELIREQLERLEGVVRVSGDGESPVFRGARLEKEFRTLFVPDVRVDVAELTAVKGGRDELVRVATRAASVYRTAEVEIHPDSVEVLAGGTSATVHGHATVTGERGGGPERDERKVTFGFARTAEGWRIDSLVVTPKRDE